jgi:hypothetical protein
VLAHEEDASEAPANPHLGPEHRTPHRLTIGSTKAATWSTSSTSTTVRRFTIGRMSDDHRTARRDGPG